MSGLKDKVVIITGASSGLGAATARRLAQGGARLMLAARREERLRSLMEELEKSDGEAAYQVTDVADRQQVESLAKATREKFGRIDVIINNAGLMPLAPMDELKTDEWNTMVDVNLKGVLHGISATLPVFREQKSGHYINLSSVAGHKVMAGGTVYCATKFAVRALSEGLRMESNGEIRVTNISPGAVDTELPDHITDENAAEMAGEMYKNAIDPQAIANAIAYAIEQPDEVDVNEMIIRPTAQEL